VRTLLGTTPRILAQRGIRLDRLAVLTLRQDAYADEPGPTRTLWLGERTHYRAAATVLDAFERPNGALGDGYDPWTPAGFGALTIASETVTAAAVASAGGLAVYTAETLSVDQWAEATISALRATGGTLARVGVGVRHDATAGTGYLAFAERTVGGGMTTRLSRYNAASATILATATTPWDPGEVLRLEAEWATLRVYRQGVLILEHVDSAPLLVTGSPALHVTRAHANDLAALDAFVAGPLRLEYVGAVADLGDVTASLGYLEPTASPATWTMTVVNVAPMGGAAGLSELIRHGTNDGPNTFEIHRSPARVVHAIRGGSASFQIAEGRVDHPEALTESTVRLACAGHDAFLTPMIQTGIVTPIPGPNPVLVPAPIPEDPCGADTVPVVVPGPTPEEPPPVETPARGPEDEEPDESEPEPAPSTFDVEALTAYRHVTVLEQPVTVITSDFFSEVEVIATAQSPQPLVGPLDCRVATTLHYDELGALQSSESRFMFLVVEQFTGKVTMRFTHEGVLNSTNAPDDPNRSMIIYVTSVPAASFETYQDIDAAPKTQVRVLSVYGASPGNGLPHASTPVSYDTTFGFNSTIIIKMAVQPHWPGTKPLELLDPFAESTFRFTNLEFVDA
jgi:hypothetical protein